MTSHHQCPIAAGLVALALAGAGVPAAAQWTNRYPKVAGFAHHVYLEGYELPSLTVGPADPAPAPDGRRLAFASRGWLWVMDLDSGTARRVTSGPGIDARPTWSPDGRTLAFVRDDTRETSIVLLDLASGTEQVAVAEPGIDLDPAFAPDGRSLFYSSAVAGDLDLWRVDLATGIKTRITEARGLELHPVPLPDGDRIVYLAKGATNDIRLRTLSTGEERTLASGAILSMLRMALRPDGRTLAYTWPASNARGWELRLLAIDAPVSSVALVADGGLPLTPAWHPAGDGVYYAEADREERMALWRAPLGGGRPEPVPVLAWDWGVPTGRLRIATRLAGRNGVAAARLTVQDARGHPLVADAGQPRFDGQTGQVFFYSPGSVDLEVPAGEVVVRAVQGLATPVVERRTPVRPGEQAEIDLTLTPVWDARAAGWLAGDHHFHLNYGGPYQLDPEDLGPMAAGEAMDVLTPLLANLHTRFEDQDLWGWQRLTEPPFIAFGQEVRSHFLGHVGLVGTAELHWPWIWGPGYEVYGRDDRANASVLAFARSQGGISTYVHPATRAGAYSPDQLAALPAALVADGVLGLFDTIELLCLWANEPVAAEFWYRLLNLGVPIALSAGTDVMNNFYRTMAVGTTRVYVRSDAANGYRAYLDALRAGRSFVTTGPMLEFTVDGRQPGDVLPRSGDARWTLEVHSAMPVDSVELVVNGRVVARFDGQTEPGTRRYEGRLRLPQAGWVAARALGGAVASWPAMSSRVYAHTAPIWIGARGSTVPEARRSAAAELLPALEAAAVRIRQAYGATPTPALDTHLARAREQLVRAARE